MPNLCAHTDGVDTSNMKMSEISELKEQRRRAMGANLIVADPAFRPTLKSDKGRCVTRCVFVVGHQDPMLEHIQRQLNCAAEFQAGQQQEKK